MSADTGTADISEEEWSPYTLYLPLELKREFGTQFPVELAVDYGLHGVQKREIQRALVEVVMNHNEEVAELVNELTYTEPSIAKEHQDEPSYNHHYSAAFGPAKTHLIKKYD